MVAGFLGRNDMFRFTATALVALSATAPMFAQEGNQPPGRRGGGRGMFGMMQPIGASFINDLQMKEVQEDLKLSDDEKAKLGPLKDELTEGDKKFAESMQDVSREERMEKNNARRAEVEKLVKEALGDKFARFSQIRMQLDGAFAAVTRNREVREKLDITEDQTTQLREAMQGMFGAPGGERPSPEKMREMMEEMQKKQAEAVDKTLTAEQKKKWDEMIGAKISYKRPPMQPGQGGGRRPRGDGDSEKKPPMI
jgi:hypothetical protein